MSDSRFLSCAELQAITHDNGAVVPLADLRETLIRLVTATAQTGNNARVIVNVPPETTDEDVADLRSEIQAAGLTFFGVSRSYALGSNRRYIQIAWPHPHI